MEILTNIAQEYFSIFLTLHLFAMVIGLGGATYSDILLMRFLNDFKISKKEAEVIETMSKVILAGIFLAFMSGVMLFLPKAEILLETPKFLAKNLIFIIVMINGMILHRVILPKLIHFSFHKEHYITKKMHLREAGFISGAISLVSWYAVFLLGSFKNVPFDFGTIMGFYGACVLCAIGMALLTEQKITQTAKDTKQNKSLFRLFKKKK